MIVIRKATPTDASAIIDFQRKMAWETERIVLDNDLVTKGVEAVFIEQSRGQYYVAEDDGNVIASLLITYEWSDWRNANIWWYQSIYVLPGRRRQGIFRSMYAVVLKEAEKHSAAGLRLYVEANNLTAQKTYESLGMNSEHYRMYEWFRE